MAITRAQIPEQIDAFQEGGDVLETSTINPQTILDLYSGLQAAPVTAADVSEQVEQISGLFPQQRDLNFFDLASAVGAGLVGSASSAGGFGVGLTAGLQSFNEAFQKRKQEKDKLRQEMALLAYQQVEARRQEQLETTKEFLELQLETALETGSADFGSSMEGKALAYIVRAESNPELKNTPEYAVAVAVVEQDKTQLVTTEQGTVPVTVPGLNIGEIFKKPPAASIVIEGTTWTLTNEMDANGDPIYTDGTNKKVIKAK
jgi:hypothetical protein